MILLYLYIAFSYGWLLHSVLVVEPIRERWEWLIVLLSPLSLIIGTLMFLFEKKNK